MAKTNITQYDSTPSNNADINSINIAENCPASNINNAIRELMAHLKNMDTGSQALTSPSFTAMSTDTINEKTSTNGVAIDSVTLKDGELGTTASPVPINSSSLNGGQFGGRRNIIINGAMQIAQRGTSVTGLGASATYPTVDRFAILGFGSTAGRLTMTQSTDTPNGFPNSVKLDCTTADTSIGSGEGLIFSQAIEGQNLQQLKKGTSDAEKLTVSFYVKGNANATYTAELRDQDNTRFNSQEFSVTTSWNRITLTFVGDTTGTLDNDNALSLYLFIWLHAGSDFTGGTHTSNVWHTTGNQRVGDNQTSFFDSTDREFFITGVQMEVGSVATPFEHRSFGEELLLCRRYTIQDAFYYSGCFGGSGTIPITSTTFPVKMRGAPTITYISGGTASDGIADYNVTGLNSSQSITDSGARILFTQTGTGAGGRGLDLKGATLRYDAEL